MKKIKFILPVLALSLLVACGGGETKDSGTSSTEEGGSTDAATTESAEYDLTSNGIPVSVTGPGGAEIKKGLANMEMEGIKMINYDVVKDMFKLSVTMIDRDTEEGEAAQSLADAKSDAQAENFGGFIKEEDNGFIYKITTEDGDDFSFYYQLEKDNRIIIFETGLSMMSNYSQEDVEAMFAAAKTAK